eukprot:147158-Pyramimonas_sp.AAC.1
MTPNASSPRRLSRPPWSLRNGGNKRIAENSNRSMRRAIGQKLKNLQGELHSPTLLGTPAPNVRRGRPLRR